MENLKLELEKNTKNTADFSSKTYANLPFGQCDLQPRSQEFVRLAFCQLQALSNTTVDFC